LVFGNHRPRLEDGVTAAHGPGLASWTAHIAAHVLACPCFGPLLDRYDVLFRLARSLRQRTFAHLVGGAGAPAALGWLGFVALGLLRTLNAAALNGRVAAMAAVSPDVGRHQPLHSATQAIAVAVLQHAIATGDLLGVVQGIEAFLCSTGNNARSDMGDYFCAFTKDVEVLRCLLADVDAPLRVALRAVLAGTGPTPSWPPAGAGAAVDSADQLYVLGADRLDTGACDHSADGVGAIDRFLRWMGDRGEKDAPPRPLSFANSAAGTAAAWWVSLPYRDAAVPLEPSARYVTHNRLWQRL